MVVKELEEGVGFFLLITNDMASNYRRVSLHSMKTGLCGRTSKLTLWVHI